MKVDPQDVRLIPKPEHGYCWNFSPEKQHLFSKHLSDQSIGVFMELCRELGRSFTAVRVEQTENCNFLSIEKPASSLAVQKSPNSALEERCRSLQQQIETQQALYDGLLTEQSKHNERIRMYKRKISTQRRMISDLGEKLIRCEKFMTKNWEDPILLEMQQWKRDFEKTHAGTRRRA